MATALAIVAEVGVAGLTMRQLSERLGVALGATYKYVPNKSALLALIAHELFTQIEHDVAEDEEWSGRVRALFVSIYDTFRAYPGLADQVAYQPPSGDLPQLGVTLVKLLSDEGLSSEAVDDLLSALFLYHRCVAHCLHDRRRRARPQLRRRARSAPRGARDRSQSLVQPG